MPLLNSKAPADKVSKDLSTSYAVGDMARGHHARITYRPAIKNDSSAILSGRPGRRVHGS